MARKDNSPAVSFFSFQDIITSVTGIMFLVVIMLVLVALQQEPFYESQRKSEELQKELTEAERQLKQTRDSLDALRKQFAERNKRIEELKKLQPEKLPALKKKWVRKLREVDASIRQLSDAVEQIERRREEQIELKAKTEVLLQKSRTAVADRQKEIAELEEDPNTPPVRKKKVRAADTRGYTNSVPVRATLPRSL